MRQVQLSSAYCTVALSVLSVVVRSLRLFHDITNAKISRSGTPN